MNRGKGRKEGGFIDESLRRLGRALVVRSFSDFRGSSDRSFRPTAEHRAFVGRQRGLWRPFVLRQREDEDAEPRPAGARGGPLYRLLLGVAHVYGLAGVAVDGSLSATARAEPPTPRPGKLDRHRAIARRADPAAIPQAGGLRDRLFRQMEPRFCPREPADRAGVRPILRPPLRQHGLLHTRLQHASRPLPGNRAGA